MRFYEMAVSRIGAVNSNYQVQVVPEPLGNPTFHYVCRAGSKPFKAIIQIQDLKLLGFENTRPQNRFFSRSERKLLHSWLQHPPLQSDHKSGWQWLLNAWNMENPDKPLDLHLPFPQTPLRNFLSETYQALTTELTITVTAEVQVEHVILEPGDRITVHPRNTAGKPLF